MKLSLHIICFVFCCQKKWRQKSRRWFDCSIHQYQQPLFFLLRCLLFAWVFLALFHGRQNNETIFFSIKERTTKKLATKIWERDHPSQKALRVARSAPPLRNCTGFSLASLIHIKRCLFFRSRLKLSIGLFNYTFHVLRLAAFSFSPFWCVRKFWSLFLMHTETDV